MTVTSYISPPGSEGVSFLEFVRADLDAVEERMRQDLGSDVRTVHALSTHLLNAGGKRLRPAMVALSARSVRELVDRSRVATVGAAVEFVHMATLVHDDVVDSAATRRGLPTANAVYGNGIAVLSGDYILARSMRLLAIDGDLRIIRTVSEITIEMSEGEVMELAATGSAQLPVDQYFEILRKKTAVFVEGCCRCGALLAHAEPAIEQALSAYGYGLGMAFQIADDLLDYSGDPARTGKPLASDLRDGRATLPFLLGLESAAAGDRRLLQEAFGCSSLAPDGVRAVCDVLHREGAFDRTRAAAASYLDRASSALSQLPDSTARDCFALLMEYVIHRDR